MTDEIRERLAARMAVALNGGAWDTHYTEEQKMLWRVRVTLALEIEKLDA